MEPVHRLLSLPGAGLRLAADRWEPPRSGAGTVLLLHGGGTVPTLLVRGTRSRVVSVNGAQELLRLVPSARLVDVDGAGHMVAGDDNDVFGEQLIGFLDDSVRLAG